VNAENDAADKVILPYLRTMGINQLDMMVISHGDNDHIGGAKTLLTNLKIQQIRSSVPDKFSQSAARLCLAGESWEWDGVKFTFLAPTTEMLGLGNDSSCVLHIDQGMHSVVLPGDIEQRGEIALLQHITSLKPVSILVAPHHGSKTSSTSAFTATLNPHVVLYATGYLNRYHFPHNEITSRYAAIESTQLNTANTGAIQIELLHNSPIIYAMGYRQRRARYWDQSLTN
jgi:competence protein ComEC